MNEFEYIFEQRKAYRIFTEAALIDIIIRKNRMIEELRATIKNTQKP